MSSKSRRSSLVKAEPLLKYGWFSRAGPGRAHSRGPLVLRGRSPNLEDLAGAAIVESRLASG